MRTPQQKTGRLDVAGKSKNKAVTKKAGHGTKSKGETVLRGKKVSRQNPTKVVFTFRVI